MGNYRPFRASGGLLWVFGGQLWSIWKPCRVANLGHLEANIVIGCLEANLGPVEANLEHLKANLGHLEANLGHLEANLGHLEANLGHL